MYWIIYLLLAYLFLVFFLTRMVIPHLGFTRTRLPDDLPRSMSSAISRLKRQSRSKRDFVERVYELLSSKYFGSDIDTFIDFNMLFIKDIKEIWRVEGYLPCTLQNYLMRIFLVRSGLFKEDDIRLRVTFIILNIHQYLQARIDGEWVDVDVWGAYRGVKVGKHVWGY